VKQNSTEATGLLRNKFRPEGPAFGLQAFNLEQIAANQR